MGKKVKKDEVKIDNFGLREEKAKGGSAKKKKKFPDMSGDGKVTPGGKKNRKKAMGGGMMMDRGMYSKGGAVAKGCGAIMSDRKKKTRMV